MNAYEKAQALGLTGTDGQIVIALKSTGLTASRIALGDLLFLLNNRGMLVRLIRPVDTGEKWSGTVVNMVLAINASGTPEQAFAVNQWFSHITNDRNQFFDTTVPEFSAPFWALSRSMADLPTMPSALDFEAVANLGGGWLFSTLTLEEYQSQKAAAQAAISQQALQSEWTTWLNESINPLIAAGDRVGVKAALLAQAGAM
jgi:hypothetical protein